MAVGDIYKLDVNQEYQASIVQNVLYYKVSTEGTSPDIESALAIAFENNVIDPTWLAAVSIELTIVCLAVQKVFPIVSTGAVRDFDVSKPGIKTGEQLPAMDSMLIQKLNPMVSGVGKKGRTYVAGATEPDQNKGRLTGAAQLLLAALAAKLQDDIDLGEGTILGPVWVIRKPDAPDKGSIIGDVEAADWTALPRIATQRRRRTPIRATI